MANRIPIIALMAACVALNVAFGTIVYLLKLPVYLDSEGIMLAALLAPGTRLNAFVVASIVAILSFVTIGVLVSPFEPWYIGTGIAGAFYGAFVPRGRVDGLIDATATMWRFASRVVFFGIGWGIVAAAVSAPVTVYLFGGVTGAGTTLIVAFLTKSGHQLLNAVLLTGFGADPIDKTASFILAVGAARFTPPAFRKLLQAA
jgi:energy-coupling factor transport system substrate-specific component